MAQVFISYSRRDKDFVRRLSAALSAHQRKAWVDWKDIPLTAEWQQEILTNIEAADTFVFVISPDSVASNNCRKEIDHAATNNKRLVPILYQSVPDDDVPETIARFQRIDLSEESSFDPGFAALIKALDTDLDWVRAHTRLLTRAKEWERQARDRSFLLRGRDLREGKDCVDRNAAREPKLTPLQMQFLLASRKAAIRQRRIMFGIAAVTAVILVALGVYNLVMQGRKEDALARSLAGRSATILSENGNTELAALLALESFQRRTTNEGAQALRNALMYLRKTHATFKTTNAVTDVAFSPDSKRLVAVTERDPIARVYDADSGKELLRLSHDAKVSKAVFSLDGRLLLTSAEDKSASVWDAVTGRQLQRFTSDSQVNAVAASSDGVVAIANNTSAQLWNAQTGRKLLSLDFPKSVSAVAFSPSGRWFVAGARDGSVQSWDRSGATSTAIHKLPTDIVDFAFSPNDESRLLIAGGKDDESSDLQIVELATGKVLGHASYRSSFRVERALFSSDSNRVLAYSTGTASVWDSHLKQLAEADVSMGRTVLAGDGRLLVTIDHETLRIADFTTARKATDLGRIPLSELTRFVKLSPDGRLLAIGSDGDNRILEVPPPLESLRMAGLGAVSDVTFSPSGRWLVIASQPSWLVDLQRPDAPLHAIGSSHADIIASDRDASKVVTGSQTDLMIWDTRTGGQLGAVSLPGGQVPAPLAFSGDSNQVLFSYTHDRIKSLNWTTGNSTEDSRFEKVHAISGDTRLLALRPDDQLIRVVETDTKREVASLPFEFAPYTLGFGGDNKMLISIDQGEGLAQLWDIGSKKEVARFSDLDRIKGAAISPDGRFAATLGYDSSVRLQLWRKEELVKHACELISGPLTHEEWKQYLPEDSYAGNRACPQFRSLQGR
jgi:WD40 repeat protein